MVPPARDGQRGGGGGSGGDGGERAWGAGVRSSHQSETPTSDGHGDTPPATTSTRLDGGTEAIAATTAAPAGPSRTAATRVAKACVPCSTKKRRCDGGKPECKVCTVLGTQCSYEVRGLKRGPPKGFRSGPKESARAKLLRALETTIRDLSLHVGHDGAGREIVRISAERGIVITESMTGKRIKREHSAPAGSLDETIRQDEGRAVAAEEEEVEDEDVLGINENGAVRHIGSSSGIQLLQHHPSSHGVRKLPGSSPNDVQNRDSPGQAHVVTHHHHQPPIVLPSITSARHHGSPTSHAGPSILTPSSGSSLHQEERVVSPSMNAKLFHHYWTGFHVFWPILYKPALDEIHVELLPHTLDTPLVNAIYALAACVACPSLDSELEVELGEGPPGDVFAQRAERYLFFGRSTPVPSFASIQCCFMLACYHQGVGQLSKAYLFSSLANSMAIDLGLHRHLHHYEHDLIERESRSRLIHCIHILSTALSAEMGRPPMLRSKDIDVPPLGEQETDEFEQHSSGRQLHTLSLLNHSRRLFAIVETVLTQVHSFRRKAALRRMGSEGIRQVVDEIDGSLENWHKSLPEWLRLPEDLSEKRDLLPSFAAVQVWFYTAKLLLHRPFIPQDEGLSLTELLEDKYHQKCTQASQRLFDILYQLASASNVDRLSTDLAYIIFTTAVMFVFNARLGHSNANKSEAGTQSEQSKRTATAVQQLSTNARRQFLMCKEWLKKLSERWPSASAHKQLLDGFSNVGEDVVTGGEAHQLTGRRPSLVNGALIPVNSSTMNDWSQLPPPSISTTYSGAPLQATSDYASLSFNQAPGSTQQASGQSGNGFGMFPFTGVEGGSASVENTQGGGGMILPQQSLNAYFAFAPNIFDMENVYWNETTTRLTPYLGPRDQTNADTSSGGAANNITFTPRTLGNIAAMANYASIGGYPSGPPQLPVSQPQQPMAPPITTPSSMRGTQRAHVAFSPRKRKATDSPGLQMLAQQAVTTASGSGTSTSGASSASGGAGNGTSSVTFSGTAGAQSGAASSASSYSPFSFHQEPSAPEWGDVISMLQLPPAFIQ